MHFAPLFAGRRYVLFRFTKDEKVMLVINKSDKADHLDLKDYDEVLQGNRVGTDALTKEKTNFEKGLDVPARSAMIIQFF